MHCNVRGEWKPLVMEMDTIVSYSFISEATHKQLRPTKQLMHTTVRLVTYTGESLAVKGSIMAQVRYGDKEAKLSLLVLTDDG